jgi:hypothetical protein
MAALTLPRHARTVLKARIAQIEFNRLSKREKSHPYKRPCSWVSQRRKSGHAQTRQLEPTTTKVWVLIAVGIAIAFVAAVQLTGTVVKVEFNRW